jgi:feruloyl esterase
MKEVQMYPEDYDGVLAGAPASWTAHLDGHQYWRNIFVNTLNTSRYITPAQFTVIKKEVLRQCDAVDGLVDGIISRPTRCTLDYSQFACNTTTSPVFNASTCLSTDQLQTYITLRNDWHSTENGELLFPAHQLGTEEQWATNSNGVPYGVTGNYFLVSIALDDRFTSDWPMSCLVSSLERDRVFPASGRDQRTQRHRQRDTDHRSAVGISRQTRVCSFQSPRNIR